MGKGGKSFSSEKFSLPSPMPLCRLIPEKLRAPRGVVALVAAVAHGVVARAGAAIDAEAVETAP